ncbi:MAG: methyl-accepting chemotaxis protein [Roseburia sp.]|nr:methyl-accepting chemotaxis protein [Roseburia sp.]MCM1278282.1 methyl-accepting chemotaxis protein [Robinsoniella sp.]
MEVKKTEKAKKAKSTKRTKSMKSTKRIKKERKKISLKIGIRTKLLIAFLAPVTALILLGVLSYSQTANAIRNLYQSSSIQILGKSADYLEVLMLDVETTAYDLSVDNDLVNYFSGTPDEGVDYSLLDAKVASMLGTDAYVENGYFIAIEGSEHISTNPDVAFGGDAYSVFQTTEDYIQVTSRNRKVWLGESEFLEKYKGEAEQPYGNRRMTLIRRVENILTGQDVGFIILEVRNSVIEQLLDEVNLGEDSMVILAGQDSNEITKAENYPEDKGKRIITNSKAYVKMQQGLEKSGSFSTSKNGKKYWLCYEYIGDLGNCLIGMIPEATMMKQANEIKVGTIGLVILVAIIVIAIGTWMAAGMSSTIKKIIKEVGKAAKGDLTVRVLTKRHDEFAVLSNSINDMIADIKVLIGKVSNGMEQVDGAVEKVSGARESVHETAEVLSDAIVQIQSGARQQEDGAQNCLTGMDDLSDKIVRVVENTKEIDSISEETRVVVNNGIKMMKELNTSSEDTTQHLKEIMEDVRALEEKISHITSIVGVITEIADQTNLLSLNASIEAARAGEAGKGFAVVATEVKTLADQSGQAAEKIREIVDEVQQQSQKTLEHGESADEILKSQEQAVKRAVDAFHNIDGCVERLNQELSDITIQTQAIEGAKNNTLAAVEGISAVIEENTASTLEMGEGINGQKEQVEKMSGYTNDLKEVSQSLREEIHKFRIS